MNNLTCSEVVRKICKKAVLKKLAQCTGRTIVRETLFNRVTGLNSANLSKNLSETPARYFQVLTIRVDP